MNLTTEKNFFNKDKDNIKWEIYFMSLAKLSALRSKDPTTKVGACIVSPNNYVISLGYNGMPTSFNNKEVDNDEVFPWNRPNQSNDVLGSKYTYVVHAEANAIINANLTNSKIEPGSSIFVTHSPCYNCAKIIVQSKISKVYYANAYKPESDDFKASLKIFNAFGIECIKIDNDFDIEFKIKNKE
ncbi:deoxycytidylate deaminase [Metamycoplasma canadense]|uniref:Deoxycytidylate deaminase n=1 Tax=Metamycoplasma canadense TaxID=29554 RepID=A0A077L5K3_9BACT|nr:dCMP deaminase family protein [Metamycoplasma canadense]BAP39550.1 deoxycytidylate deaminase [Metamycoplasma canadense]